MAIKSNFVLRTLCSALICALGVGIGIHAHASSQQTQIREYLKYGPRTIKSAPGTPEAKMGAIFQDELNKSSLHKSPNSPLSAIVTVEHGQAQQVANLLTQSGASIQHIDGNQLYVVAGSTTLKNIALNPSVKALDLQGESKSTNDLQKILGQIGLNNTTIITDDSTLGVGHTPTTNTGTYNPTATIRDPNDVGLRLMNAQLLHQYDMYGQGIKIGIIDFGYQGYTNLQNQGVVPKAVSQKTFNGNTVTNTLTTNQGSPHGTAVAEIIYNLAPRATYYLAQVGPGNGGANEGDILSAMKWLRDQGVHIINFSGGGHYGPKDGTDTQSRLIDTFSSEGILWVNASGNEGNEYWRSTLTDKDSDYIVDNEDTLGIPFTINSSGHDGYFSVTWNDWIPNSTVDVDLFIINQHEEIVAKKQAGRNPNTAPADTIDIPNNLPVGKYSLVLATATPNPKMNVHVHLSAQGIKLDQYTPVGSVGIPATAKSALAVGAWDAETSKLATYSSWGPTDDERLKPELAAPTNTYSMSYGYNFQGTSASAPYASGFAALIWSGFPKATASQVKSAMIMELTKPVSQYKPSLATGYGLLDARVVFGQTKNLNLQKDYRPSFARALHSSSESVNHGQPQPVSNPGNSLNDILRNIGIQ